MLASLQVVGARGLLEDAVFLSAVQVVELTVERPELDTEHVVLHPHLSVLSLPPDSWHHSFDRSMHTSNAG